MSSSVETQEMNDSRAKFFDLDEMFETWKTLLTGTSTEPDSVYAAGLRLRLDRLPSLKLQGVQRHNRTWRCCRKESTNQLQLELPENTKALARRRSAVHPAKYSIF